MKQLKHVETYWTWILLDELCLSMFINVYQCLSYLIMFFSVWGSNSFKQCLQGFVGHVDACWMMLVWLGYVRIVDDCGVYEMKRLNPWGEHCLG